MDDLIAEGVSERQKALLAKHGTPAGFAQACYELVPGTISMDEAKAAVAKYQAEWDEAAEDGFSGSNEVSRSYSAPEEGKPLLPPWESA